MTQTSRQKLTSIQLPSSTSMAVLSRRHCLAILLHADGCWSCCKAWMMWSWVQLSPQLAGQPLLLYDCNSRAAESKLLTIACGPINPNLPIYVCSNGMEAAGMIQLFSTRFLICFELLMCLSMIPAFVISVTLKLFNCDVFLLWHDDFCMYYFIFSITSHICIFLLLVILVRSLTRKDIFDWI